MATLVARRRKDGTVAHRVQWRLVGSGPWQSETFDDKRAAAKFQAQVEAHGHLWPEGWVKGWGYGAPPALDDEPAGDLLIDFGTAYVRRPPPPMSPSSTFSVLPSRSRLSRSRAACCSQ